MHWSSAPLGEALPTCVTTNDLRNCLLRENIITTATAKVILKSRENYTLPGIRMLPSKPTVGELLLNFQHEIDPPPN